MKPTIFKEIRPENRINMEFFVDPKSIVRKIWGKSDTVLFIFAGASAEFALNKAVDWLFFTGRLPADPLARLFSTVSYARKIVFMPYTEAIKTIDAINSIHKSVEEKRGDTIPQWSYKDVLYMLIDYSISSYELLENKLSEAEKDEVYNVFFRIGKRMNISNLPTTYNEWLPDREKHLNLDLEKSIYSEKLYLQYRKHLGPIRYYVLLQVQQMVCPQEVKNLLKLKYNPIMSPALGCYKFSRVFKMDKILKSLFLPSNYKQEIRELDTY